MGLRELLQLLAERRGITQNELCQRLGYRSRTSLARLESGRSTRRALESFYRRAQQSLELTREESDGIREIIGRAFWQEDYEATREMMRFLGRGARERGHMMLCRIADLAEEEFLSHFSGKENLEFVLLNSGSADVFPQLLQLCGAGAKIRHYVSVSDDPLPVIRLISEILPLVFERGYRCASVSPKDVGKALTGFAYSDMLFASYDAPEGARQEAVLFDRPDHGFIMEGREMLAYLRAKGRRTVMRPIKRTFEEADSPQGYAAYCRYCGELEKDAAIWKIKPDVSLEWIPAELIGLALLENPEFGMPGDDAVPEAAPEEILGEILRIQRARYRETFSGGRPKVTLMKRGALRRFAETGRTMDHFFGMRSFTPAERRAILQGMLDGCRCGRGFSVRLLREDDALSDVYVTLFEGKGVLVFDSHTDYRLGDRHGEVLLDHPGFGRVFREYFEHVLLGQAALPEADSLAFLEELVRGLPARDERERPGRERRAALIRAMLEE